MTASNDVPPGRKPEPGVAQVRISADTGKRYIHVEKPRVGRFFEMPPEEFAEFRARIMATQPSQEEIEIGHWADE